MGDKNTILLVEDDENDVLLIQRAFQKAALSYSLKVVRDGDQAIQYLSRRNGYANREQFPEPFLILLDLKMPGVDGFEVLRWARTQADLKRLLIVVLTSSALQADVNKAYDLGANSYLVKPVSLEEMAHMIQRFEAYWTEINRVPTARKSADSFPAQTLMG